MQAPAKVAIKFMNDQGKEVAREEATHALVTTYDEEGNLINETFGRLDTHSQE